MIDFMLLAILCTITWCVAQAGAVEAGLTCLSVIFAGLLAMNYFEPLAAALESSVFSSEEMRFRSDLIALVGLFVVLVSLFRVITEYLSPTFIQVRMPFYEVGRWGCAVLTGYVTMAFLLTALHTAPLPREFLGFRAERKNLFGLAAPDRQWLGFVQLVSETSLRKAGRNRIFDGPIGRIGNHANRIWPSFPIRYATRREQIESGYATQQPDPRGGQQIE